MPFLLEKWLLTIAQQQTSVTPVTSGYLYQGGINANLTQIGVSSWSQVSSGYADDNTYVLQDSTAKITVFSTSNSWGQLGSGVTGSSGGTSYQHSGSWKTVSTDGNSVIGIKTEKKWEQIKID